jgi:hypothetical protein
MSKAIRIYEWKVRQYWKLSRAWRGQSEEYIPPEYTLNSLRMLKATSNNFPNMQDLCTKMIDEIVFQLNATDAELEALP